MINNASMPSSAVIPVLGYPDVRGAVEWLVNTFGFRERLRIGEHRAQLSFGSGHVVVTQSSTGSDTNESAASAVMVRILDVDAHYLRTKRAGVRIAAVPETFSYGERQYSAIDLAGHRWTFSESVANVEPSSWGGTLVEHTT